MTRATLHAVPRSVLVGRGVEIAALAASVDELVAGRGGVVLLAGEPGIGKSRLAEDVAERATAADVKTAWGRAWEAGGAPPFWPWIQVLRTLAPDAEVIARLLGGPHHAATSPEDRFLLFDAATRALADAGTATVLLEDLHAFDDASLHLLAFVAQHALPILLVGTYRTAEAKLTPVAGSVLEKLARNARTIAPRRLTADDVHALADPYGLDAAALAQVIARAEGNPLFATELLRVHRVGGVPDSVRAAIREHLRALPPELLPVLEVAAVIGRELAGTLVAQLCDAEVADALAAAVELGILVERGSGRFAFAHGLIAATLHHDLPAARRAQLHLRVAVAFERAHAGDPNAPWTEIAHHLFDAGPEHAARAVEVARRAAERSRDQLAFESAATLVERALEVVPPNDVAGRFELLRLLAEVSILAGDVPKGRDHARQAAALARALGSPELLARAALAYGGSWSLGSTDLGLLALLEEALAALPPGDHPLRARMLARLASALQPARDPGPPLALARDAIAMTERLGDDRNRLEVLFAASGALVLFAPSAECRRVNLAALALAERFGESLVELRQHQRLVFDHAGLADLAGVAHHQRRYDELVERLRLPAKTRSPSAMFRAMVALVEGRMADHDAAYAEAERLAEGDGFFRDVTSVGHRVAVLDQTADPRTLGEHRPLYASMTAWGRGWMYVDTLAGCVARSGDLESARGLLTREHVEFLVGHRVLKLGTQAAHTIWLLGDAELAKPLHDWLAAEGPALGMLLIHGFAIGSPAAHGAMLLAATLGDLVAVRRHHAVAARVVRSMQARPLEAWLCHDLATILIRTRDRSFRDEAAQLLAQAATLAAASGIAMQRSLDALAAELAARPQPVLASVADVEMRNEGEVWFIAGLGASCRLKSSRGVELLARLITEPNRELHVLELLGGEAVDGGDAGEMLDATAKATYQRRLRELREELDEAEQWNDSVRAERARDEIDALETELARAAGLGGRTRRVGGAAERARVNVQRRLADAIRRIGEAAPELGKYLGVTVRTGVYCSYLPDRIRIR